jgi:hypothetical protein
MAAMSSQTVPAATSSRRRRLLRLLVVTLAGLAGALGLFRTAGALWGRRAVAARAPALKAEVARLHAAREARVLPPFEGAAERAGDCAERQAAAPAPRLPADVQRERDGAGPLTGGQKAFVREHAAVIEAVGRAAVACDRLRPNVGRDDDRLSGWQRPFDIHQRARMLRLAGKDAEESGTLEAAVVRYLQSHRLAVELGLGDDIVGAALAAEAVAAADRALARALAGADVPAPLRARAAREMEALQPFMPDEGKAMRASYVEQAARLVGIAAAMPMAYEIFAPAPRPLREGETNWRHTMGQVLFPFSVHVAVTEARAAADAEAAMVALTRPGGADDHPQDGQDGQDGQNGQNGHDGHDRSGVAEDPSPAAGESLAGGRDRGPSWSAWSTVLGSDPDILVGRARRGERTRLAAAALLRAVLAVAEARARDGAYPAAPQLPADPFAPGHSLTYARLAEGGYRVASVGPAGADAGARTAWTITVPR